MQRHEKVSKTNIQRWVRGWQVRWVPCLRWGGNNRGQRRRGRRGARIDGVKSGVKENAVELRLGYGRWVPVENCIATTGSMPGKGCDAMGFEGRRDYVWSAVKEGKGKKMTVYRKDFGKEIGGADEAGKEDKTKEMLVCPVLKPV